MRAGCDLLPVSLPETEGGRRARRYDARMWLVALAACVDPPPPDRLSRPNAVVVAPDGSVFVSDFGHDRIVVFDADGRHTQTFGGHGIGPAELWRVYALAVAPADAPPGRAGDLLVVNRRPLDARSTQGHVWEIQRFRGGEEVARSRFDGHFSSASHTMHSLAVRGDGSMIVANPGGGEVFELDPDGRFVGRIGGVPLPDAAPHALAIDGSTTWVVEQRAQRVVRLEADGARIFRLDDQGQGPLSFPSAVAVCPGEWLAIADLGNHRVQRYDLDGRWLGGFEPARA